MNCTHLTGGVATVMQKRRFITNRSKALADK